MKFFTATVLLLVLATITNAVKLEIKPFKRLIPADVLRDFRDSCFASTQCKVYGPGEGWSLAPFCGASKLVKDGADPKAEFPGCCPVYECEEGAEVKYVKTPAQKKKEAEAKAKALAESQE